MQSQNRFFEDLSKVANGAAGTLAGVGREFETLVRQGVERFMSGPNFIDRAEFEAVKEMAANARAEVDALRARLDAMGASAAAKPVEPTDYDPTAAALGRTPPGQSDVAPS